MDRNQDVEIELYEENIGNLNLLKRLQLISP